ncbi:ABC transporter ATP-binding protein [Snodgrassella sp. ESL0253]|uniref:ABC transporter ATP-binding protein n=1 Tax=Snodgrassella sp. ESL0253 TaxID=2705031 RepID=UPI001582EA77|nr:ABC transporter ATP-binding protein [Snodgrassella sp. ESL0253]NUE66446.1 ABC transporter ATP-binding protein [Snodgrassella sp. ESL0253]
MENLFTVRNMQVQARSRCILSVPQLDLPANQHTSIIGPNGAGKSTLLRALLGLHGTGVQLRGESVGSNLKRGQIAWVGQHGQYNLPLTVTEYVQLGCYPHGGWFKKAQAPTTKLQYLLDVFDLRPLAQQRIGSLSGGEQQRANVVRALLQNAPVLLLDEPCNHLDIRHQHRLMHYLREHHAEFSVVMVLHDLTMAANHADFIVLMNEGQIVATGTPHDVMQSDLLSEVYQWPIRRIEEDGKLFFRMAHYPVHSAVV